MGGENFKVEAGLFEKNAKKTSFFGKWNAQVFKKEIKSKKQEKPEINELPSESDATNEPESSNEITPSKESESLNGIEATNEVEASQTESPELSSNSSPNESSLVFDAKTDTITPKTVLPDSLSIPTDSRVIWKVVSEILTKDCELDDQYLKEYKQNSSSTSQEKKDFLKKLKKEIDSKQDELLEAAINAKTTVENKMREKANELESKKQKFSPKFFEKVGDSWKFIGKKYAFFFIFVLIHKLTPFQFSRIYGLVDLQ